MGQHRSRTSGDERAEICYGGNMAEGVWWDIIRDRGDEWELEVKVEEDAVVRCLSSSWAVCA